MIRTYLLNKWVQDVCESYYYFPANAQVIIVTLVGVCQHKHKIFNRVTFGISLSLRRTRQPTYTPATCKFVNHAKSFLVR
jgi:hypothetical protein